MTLPLLLASAAQPGIAETFGLETKYIIMQVISFLVVLAVLYKFGIKPVTATMEERNRKIEAGIRHAEEMQAKLAAAQQESAAIVRQANTEAARLVEDARRSAKEFLDRQTQEAAGKAADLLAKAQQAIELEHSVAVSALPGFREGRVSVQDSAAQLAAVLLAAKAGQRVLDACAAPGGKTAHILQRDPGVSLLAVDSDAERLAMVTSTLARIGLRADCRVADLALPEAVADLPPFERILLDAPCSATGVIRRHPDIKLLRRESDIAGFARVQRQILRNVFARLAPGGRLVYATCSVLPEENEAVVLDFLATEPAARSLPWPSDVMLPPGAVRLEAGTQLLPGAQAGSDGFYYACLGRGSGE